MNVLNASPEQLRKLIKYPALVDFRIIIDANCDDALQQITDVCNKIEPNGVKPLTQAPRKSRTGKYFSYTQVVQVSSYENLQEIYKKVGALDCVKHIL